MKNWKFRQKLSILILLISATLSLLIWLLPINQVLTGYRIINGIESTTYVLKEDGIISIIMVPGVVCLIWNFLAKRNDLKMQDNDKLYSYRFRGAVMDVVFFLLASLPSAFGIANIVLYLTQLN
jgi:hypothetical protein